MKAVPARVSAADIIIPSSAPRPPVTPRPPAGSAGLDIDLLLHRIKQMLDTCGTSDRNQLLIITISALIDAGVNTDRRIVGAASCLGFKPGHAGSILKHSQGGDPDRHKWQRGADGVYSVHETRLAA